MDHANTAERTEPATCDQAAFRRAAGCWATGVAVITTVDAGGRPFGLTMSAVSSLSLAPQQFLICVERSADSLPALQESRLFCINYLSSAQEGLAPFRQQARGQVRRRSLSVVRVGAATPSCGAASRVSPP